MSSLMSVNIRDMNISEGELFQQKWLLYEYNSSMGNLSTNTCSVSNPNVSHFNRSKPWVIMSTFRMSNDSITASTNNGLKNSILLITGYITASHQSVGIYLGTENAYIWRAIERGLNSDILRYFIHKMPYVEHSQVNYTVYKTAKYYVILYTKHCMERIISQTLYSIQNPTPKYATSCFCV